MHRRAFDVLGLDAEYMARRTPPDEVASTMRDTHVAGGNVTLPHKLRAARTLTRPSTAVGATGACNCWWRGDDGELEGDNTDVGGLQLALSRLGFEPRGSRVLLLGAGGAARAAVHALLEGGASSVEIVNRTPARARALRAAAVAHAPDRDHALRVVDAPRSDTTYDLVLNATSLGLSPGDPLPLEPDTRRGGARFRAAFDMAYAPRGTAWVHRARAFGIPARDGLDMLVGQATLSLERWFPGRAAPFDAMREAAVAELERRAVADPGDVSNRE